MLSKICSTEIDFDIIDRLDNSISLGRPEDRKTDFFREMVCIVGEKYSLIVSFTVHG